MNKLLLFIATLLLTTSTAFAEPSPRPVIGISGVSADYDSVRAMMTSINSAGGTPLYLGNYAERNPKADIQKIDALVIMGNAADIDPALYGEKEHPETVNEMKTPKGRARAAYEYTIMKEALAQKMPLLGICGGEQRINVLRGGTLHQHVPDLVGNDTHAQHHRNIAPFIAVVPVNIVPGTKLAALADTVDSLYVPGHDADKEIMENSMHHQAVGKLGDGLRAAAYSDAYIQNGKKYRLIEAVEPDPNGPLKDQFVLGVQWHPEFGASPLAPKISATLVEEAQRFASEHQRTHPEGEARKENLFSDRPEMKPAEQ